MVLLIDNFDSFTYNLVDYLRRLGSEVVVRRNDTDFDEWKRLNPTAVLISPGPGTPQAAGAMPRALDYFAEQKPVLGVCLGHQAIGVHFGAVLRKAAQPMHGKISTLTADDPVLFGGMPKRFKVVRYHSLVLDNLPPCLVGTAYTDNGELMALRHRRLPIWGVQFHPEAALTEYGLQLLSNWLKAAGLN